MRAGGEKNATMLMENGTKIINPNPIKHFKSFNFQAPLVALIMRSAYRRPQSVYTKNQINIFRLFSGDNFSTPKNEHKKAL